jgi:hypothetical protein
VRSEFELDRFSLERTLLRDEERALSGTTGSRGSLERLDLLTNDAQRKEPQSRTGPKWVDGEFRRQHKHHQNEPCGEQRGTRRERDALSDINRFVSRGGGCGSHIHSGVRK